MKPRPDSTAWLSGSSDPARGRRSSGSPRSVCDAASLADLRWNSGRVRLARRGRGRRLRIPFRPRTLVHPASARGHLRAFPRPTRSHSPRYADGTSCAAEVYSEIVWTTLETGREVTVGSLASLRTSASYCASVCTGAFAIILTTL